MSQREQQGIRKTENEPDYYRPSLKSRFDKDKRVESGEEFPYKQETMYWANIKGQYMLQPILGGDGRVLVKVDEFRSKYACTACKGKGHTEEPCPRCNGTKLYFDGTANSPCQACTVGSSDGRKTYGFKLCPQCKGTQGTIIIPDMSQKASESGDVLAISRVGINILKPGMKILMATYTGVPFKFLDIDMRVLIEKDVLGILRQLKSNTENIEQGTYADLDNVGIAHE